MNLPTAAEEPDNIDLFLKAGIFLTFAVFAVALLFIRLTMNKRKHTNKTLPAPPKPSAD